MRSNFQTGACHQLLSSNHYFTGKKWELCRRTVTLSSAADTQDGWGPLACSRDLEVGLAPEL